MLEINQLSVDYGPIHALENVSLRIKKVPMALEKVLCCAPSVD